MNRFLTLLFCLALAGAHAQTTTADINQLDAYWNINLTKDQKLQTVLTESQTQIASPAAGLNTVVIQQNGNNNQARLTTTSGIQNLLSVSQANDGNVTDATLSGINNSLIIGQTGGSNTTNINLGGINNRFLLTQDGNDTINMLGLQKDNTRLELSQKSGANSFTLDNSNLLVDPLSKGIPNLRIEQSGGASITVTQGHIIGN